VSFLVEPPLPNQALGHGLSTHVPKGQANVMAAKTAQRAGRVKDKNEITVSELSISNDRVVQQIIAEAGNAPW
jgi:hypothetical protein